MRPAVTNNPNTIMLPPTSDESPKALLPHGAWDTHHHIFEPSIFPYHPNRHLTPPAATLAQYKSFKSRLGITNSVLTHGMSYGDDCTSLKSFVPALDSNLTRGIGIIDPATTTDAELLSMRDSGIRGLRVNLYRYNAMQDVEAQKRALLEHRDRLLKLPGLAGWSLTMTTVRTDFWEELAPFIEAEFGGGGGGGGGGDKGMMMTIPLITDHFALLKANSLLSPSSNNNKPVFSQQQQQPGFQAILSLLRKGLLYVKLSAPYRISDDAPRYQDVRGIVRSLVDANPDRVLWGSDWPHTPRMRATPRTEEERLAETPFLEGDMVDDEAWLGSLKKWLSDEEWGKLMVGNPRRVFG